MGLNAQEIEKLANKPKVKKIAVENFLMSMGNDCSANYENAQMDRDLYHWNAPTFNAIMKGISKACSKRSG